MLTRPLAEFPAFQGLPFDRIVGPVCFQLRSQQYAPSLPTDCRSLPANKVLVQYLTPADLIWYDSRAEEGIPVTITNGTDADPGQICPNSAPSCDIVYTPPQIAATPTTIPTATPAYTVIPLSGKAVVKKSTLFRAGPGPQYDVVASVSGGTYTITGQNQEQTYYQVDYNGAIAWVSAFSSNVSFEVQSLPTPTGAPTDVPLNAALQYGQVINGALSRNQKTNYTKEFK